MPIDRRTFLAGSLATLFAGDALAQQRKRATAVEPEFPPVLPDGKSIVSFTSPEVLTRSASLRDGVAIARTPPAVDVLYYPGQTYRGNIWSNWGEGTVGNGKYYSAIGDHLAPAGTGRVFEFDPEQKSFKQLLDLKTLLNLPEGHYCPGKIHSRVEMASDGWIYCSTHRGSTKATTAANHYKGDWIVRCHPATGKSEVVTQAPVPLHCIPTGRLDPQRMIFYGATAPGDLGDDGGWFFAYDLKDRRVVWSGPNGPSRAMILAKSTGRVYFTPGAAGMSEGPLMRFDSAKPGTPEDTGIVMGLRAATDETSDGLVYAVSHAKGTGSTLYRFDTKSEQLEILGQAAVGNQQYVASLAVDPAGQFVYYVPGAHGGSDQDGTPIVQFDTRSRQKKVLAFLEPACTKVTGGTLKGTYSVAVDAGGERLFITWNVSRGSKNWDCCALTMIHVPESERSV